MLFVHKTTRLFTNNNEQTRINQKLIETNSKTST